MSSPQPAAVVPRRSYARWILAGLLLLIAPVVIVAVGVLSLVTLNRDAALLRREVMAATGSDWSTKVQLDLGWCSLGLARAVAACVNHEKSEDVRLALAAVKHASVGVYERRTATGSGSAANLFAETDRLMEKRGWTRLIGVADGDERVIVYTSDAGSGDRVDLCLAVLDGRELVVVSTQVEARALSRLVEKHTPGNFRSKLQKLEKLEKLATVAY